MTKISYVPSDSGYLTATHNVGLSLFRCSLLSQVEVRCTQELLLKESAQSLVSRPPERAGKQYLPVDISIDIEVSGVVESPSQSEHNITSFAAFHEESNAKECEAYCEEESGGGRRPSSLKIRPKSQTRQSKKARVSEFFQLEVS